MQMPSLVSNRVSAYSLFSVHKLYPACHLYRPTPPLTIGALPDEILSVIFQFTTHDFHDCYDAIFHAITISHVCQHWRIISLSTTSLWTVIVLTFPIHHNQFFRTITYLMRSRSRPLHLYLDFRDPTWNWDEASHHFSWKNMENVMRLLLPHVHRWQKVELLTDTWAPIFTFLSYTSHIKSAPMLQDVVLSRCNAFFAAKGEIFRPSAMKKPIAWFDGGSAFHGLRRVSLAGVHVDWEHSGLSGLLELQLKYHTSEVMPTLRQFCNIISACPKLERLGIMGWGPQINSDALPAQCSLHLPHLQSFAFGFIDVDYAIDLLSLFHFPTLKALSLEDVSSLVDPSHPCDASRLLDYLTATNHECAISSHTSPCTACCPYPLSSLSTLELHSLTSSEASLRGFLRKTSTLEHLLLYALDKSNLEAIAPDLITSLLCPSLHDLKFKNAEESSIAGLSVCLPFGEVSPRRVIVPDITDMPMERTS